MVEVAEQFFVLFTNNSHLAVCFVFLFCVFFFSLPFSRLQQSETDLQKENQNYVSLFRQQTAATEEDLAIMKAQYAATQDLYEKRIRYLEGRIDTLKQKSARIQRLHAHRILLSHACTCQLLLALTLL